MSRDAPPVSTIRGPPRVAGTSSSSTSGSRAKPPGQTRTCDADVAGSVRRICRLPRAPPPRLAEAFPPPRDASSDANCGARAARNTTQTALSPLNLAPVTTPVSSGRSSGHSGRPWSLASCYPTPRRTGSGITTDDGAVDDLGHADDRTHGSDWIAASRSETTGSSPK
jgi:hypothetical protein